MTTYEYECKNCKHSFDVFQNFKDEPLKTCPKCKKELRRLIYGGNGVIFKGGGFYVTDKNGKQGKSESILAESKPAESPCATCKAAETQTCPQAAV